MGNGQKLGSSDSRSVSLSSPAVGLWLLSLGRSLGTGAVRPSLMEFGVIWLGCKSEFFSGKVYALCCRLVVNCLIDGQTSEPSQRIKAVIILRSMMVVNYLIRDPRVFSATGGLFLCPWSQGVSLEQPPLIQSLGAAQSESFVGKCCLDPRCKEWGKDDLKMRAGKEEPLRQQGRTRVEPRPPHPAIKTLRKSPDGQWLALGAFAAVALGSTLGQGAKVLLSHAAQPKRRRRRRETLRDHACNPSALQTRLKRIRTFFRVNLPRGPYCELG